MKWLPKSVAETEIDSLAHQLRSVSALHLNGDAHLPATLARLLVMRGITDPAEAERYLIPSLAHLHSPYLMTGMRQAGGGREGGLLPPDSDAFLLENPG